MIHCCPSNDEGHRAVGEWFDDPKMYDFLGTLIALVPTISMRH
jgi:hypothetical protein